MISMTEKYDYFKGFLNPEPISKLSETDFILLCKITLELNEHLIDPKNKRNLIDQKLNQIDKILIENKFSTLRNLNYQSINTAISKYIVSLALNDIKSSYISGKKTIQELETSNKKN